EFIFNDNKNLLALDTDTSDRIKAVKNFLAVLSDSICSLFIVNGNLASIPLGNESFLWVVLCHGAFCFLKKNSLIVA
ncbi:hypothetical protein J4W15_25800, partial [Escherichia coli]